MVKDRLAEIQNQRQEKPKSTGKADKEKKKLLAAETSQKDAEHLDIPKRIDAEMGEIEEELESLRGLHARILSQSLTTALASELNAKTDEIHARILRVKGDVMTINNAAAGISKKKEATANQRILSEQAKRLTRNLIALKDKFENEQLAYKEKSKKMYTDYLRILGTDLAEAELEDALQSGTLSQKMRGALLKCDQQRTRHEVQQRTDDILNVEKSIRELSEMFLDLHAVVVSQDEMLDNIERNVQNSADYVQNGKQTIKDALKLKRKAMKWKILLIGGLIVFVLIVGGVILLAI